MRIAILLPNNIFASEGGGFSYIENLLESMLSLESNHTFIPLLLVDKKSKVKTSPFWDDKFAKIEKIIYQPKYLYLPKGIRFFGLFFSAGHKMNRIRVLYNKFCQWYLYSFEIIDRKCLDQVFKDFSVDLLYYPLPSKSYHYDFPFYATVWDLGHRVKPDLTEVSGNGQFALREKMYLDILPRASKVMAESEQGKKEISFFYNIPPGNIGVVPMFPGKVANLSVQEDKMSAYLDKLGLAKKEFLFYPAQFWPHKNHINLIKAVSWLRKEQNKSIHLVLTGSDKGNHDYIKASIKEYGIEDLVKILGFVSQEEITMLYKSAKSLVMPTILGPTNMPIMEAIYNDCLVVCSGLPGHKEQAKSAALYFDPFDYKEIGVKIMSLDGAKEMLHANAQKIKQENNNSVEQACAKLNGFFDEFYKIRELQM